MRARYEPCSPLRSRAAPCVEFRALADARFRPPCSRSGFDHHCVYLQTCIGQHNYAAFFALISSVFLWCVLVVALDVLFLIPSTLAPFGAPLNRCREEPT